MSARTTSQTASSLADDVAQLAAGGDAALARTVAAHGRPALDAVVPLFAGRWRAQVTPGTMIRLIRGPEVIARLAELARNLELEIQPFAAAALGHTRDAEALAPLLAMLDAPFTTEVAARALGELGRVDALGPLVARWHGLVGGAQSERWQCTDAGRALDQRRLRRYRRAGRGRRPARRRRGRSVVGRPRQRVAGRPGLSRRPHRRR